jgi:penicillin-binding protein 2
VVPESIEDLDTLVATLAQRLSMTPSDVRSRIDLSLPAYYFLPIKTLPPDTPERAVDELHALPGVLVREERQRLYPHGDLAAHVLGYITEISQEQLDKLKDKGYREGDKIGAAGLEGSYESELAGKKGGTLAIVSTEGTVARVMAERPATPGDDIYLTMDVNVQKLSEELLGQKKGSIVAIDPNSNGILAMASYPRFDPNAFIRGLSSAEWQALNSNTALPFLNRATQASYPPGSTFKVVTTAAGLERGGYSPSSRLPCPPVWVGLGPQFAKNNWQSVDRGALTLAEGLMASCNPVFYEVALKLDDQDPNILPSIASSFGLGQPTGIAGIDEVAGLVPTPEWKRSAMGEPWYSGDSVNMGIGQGFLLVTPVQTANIYSTIINSGVVRKPLLVSRITTPDGSTVQQFEAEHVRTLEFSSSTWAAIREGLTLVVANPGGTAYSTFVGSRVPIAGKSGTAEDIVFQDHVFFVGYAPREAPQAVTIVALEEGQSGSREAGPIVRRILETYAAGVSAVRQISD